MRLRLTAFPNARLMLQPNRLSSRPLARRKTANSRLDRRRPSRYTASYSARRTRRAARGKSCRGVSDSSETVAPLLAACRKYFPSTLALHASAESMLLMTAPHMRLKSAFRQRSFSSALRSISLIYYALRTLQVSPGTFHWNRAVLPRQPRRARYLVVGSQGRFLAALSFRQCRGAACFAFSVANRAPKRNNESRRPPHIGQGNVGRLESGVLPMYLAPRPLDLQI
jgi:hypothetical protein